MSSATVSEAFLFATRFLSVAAVVVGAYIGYKIAQRKVDSGVHEAVQAELTTLVTLKDQRITELEARVSHLEEVIESFSGKYEALLSLKENAIAESVVRIQQENART